MITTAALQNLVRPDLDEVYAALGQQVTLYAQQAQAVTVGAQPPEEIDEFGNPASSPAPDPTPDTPGAGRSLGTFPCVFMQVDVQDQAQRPGLGSDLAVPLWEGYIHWTAPLATPGVLLVVEGGELPEPLHLTPLADAEDIGTQRLCWAVVCSAPGALRG